MCHWIIECKAESRSLGVLGRVSGFHDPLGLETILAFGMPWWTLLWTWAVVVAQTATQNLLPFPSTGLAPAPKLVRVGAGEGDGPDLILVFFPGFRIVPWLGGKINVEHKARALVDAVSGPGHRLFL